MTVGLIGMGEVGGVFLAELRSAGNDVVCLDARPGATSAARAKALGVTFASSAMALAMHRPSIVLVAVPGTQTLAVADAVVASLPAGTVYADASTKAPDERDRVANRCQSLGVAYADVAIMDTVGWPGRSVTLLVSGAGADAVSRLFALTLFRPITLDAERLLSAEVKLGRSMFTKGLIALLLETLVIADLLGIRRPVQESLDVFMAEEFSKIVELLVGSSLQHARRRSEEMAEVVALTHRALADAPMARAASAVLDDVATRTHPVGDSEAQPQNAESVLRWLIEHDFLGDSSAGRASPQ